MVPANVIAVGGSTGAVPALQAFISALPPTLPASVLVVLHLRRTYEGRIDEFLARSTDLPVTFASDGEAMKEGHVYFAPPDRNMSIEQGAIHVSASPREGMHIPSINVLFRSVAQQYARRAIGVLLSGLGEDGVAGLWEIRRHGGRTMVQDPEDCGAPQLTRNALSMIPVDHTLCAAEIGAQLGNLVTSVRAAPPSVMIVDPDATAATKLAGDLRDFGYDVADTVRTGEMAVASAEVKRPDLLIMDLALAGPMSGVAAARQIWDRQRVPVIYLTGLVDPVMITPLLGPHAAGYLMKPYRKPELAAMARLALVREQYQRRNVPAGGRLVDPEF